MKPRFGLSNIVSRITLRSVQHQSVLMLCGLILSGCTTTEMQLEAPLNTPIPLPAVLPGQSAIAIDSLAADKQDETVVVTGTVARRVPLLAGWLYLLQDETGSLWVMTQRPAAPEVGDQATVEGLVRYETIAVEAIDASEVYLEEQSYRQIDS